MLKYLIYTIIYLTVFTQLSAQKYDKNWVLGAPYFYPDEYLKPIELVFNDTGVQILPFHNTLDMRRDAISISNKEGKLLFYTNGNHIESANGKRMENGDGLNVGSPYADNTPDNNDFYFFPAGEIVLPDSKEDNLFYLLHIFDSGLDTTYPFVSPKLQITKIDMSKNNGAGKVVYKNKTLANVYSSPRINATKHANGADWWVMLRQPNGNSFTELLVHKDSVILNRHFELAPMINYDYWDSIETSLETPIYFSPNGEILVDIFGQKTVRIFDFDRCTGDINLRDTLQFKVDTVASGTVFKAWSGVLGCTISSNSRFLYTSNYLGIKQFDLQADSISKTQVQVGNMINSYDEFQKPIPLQYFAFFYGQLGPDGKIYIFDAFNQHIINKPDEKGLACDFCSLPSCFGINKFLGIPYYPNYRLGAIKGSACDTILSSVAKQVKDKYNLKFYPNPSSSYVQVEITLPYYDQNHLPVLQLYDMLGREVYNFEFPAFAYMHKIETGALIPGSYFSTLKVSGKIVKTGSLIISK